MRWQGAGLNQAGSVCFRRGASEGFEEKKYRILLTVHVDRSGDQLGGT